MSWCIKAIVSLLQFVPLNQPNGQRGLNAILYEYMYEPLQKLRQ